MDLYQVISTGVISSVIAFLIIKSYDKIMSKAKSEIQKRHDEQQKNYYKVSSSDDFIQWQNKLLEKYYGRENFTNILGEWYPVRIFKGVEYPYPFEGLCDAEELICNEHIDYTKTPHYEEYKNLISDKIRRPEMRSYMLKKLSFNDKSQLCHFTARVGTYAECAYTSHILDYENYLLYKKHGKKDVETAFEKIKRDMTIRNAIHEGKKPLEVLSSGCNRASMLVVQLVVLIKDWNDHQYKTLLIKRSQNVAERAGFFQFVPTGGFEIFHGEGKKSEYIYKEHFSPVDAVFREYLEEAFDLKEFELGGSRTLHNIKNHDMVMEIKDMIKNKTAHFEFLGTAISLVSLKNELSFVLRIDDENYSRNNIGNMMPNFEGEDFEPYPIIGIENYIDKKKFNPPSAALLAMLKENHLYKEIANEGGAAAK